MAYYLLHFCHETNNIHSNTISAPLTAPSAEKHLRWHWAKLSKWHVGILLKRLPPVTLSGLLTGTGVRSGLNSCRAWRLHPIRAWTVPSSQSPWKTVATSLCIGTNSQSMPAYEIQQNIALTGGRFYWKPDLKDWICLPTISRLTKVLRLS